MPGKTIKDDKDILNVLQTRQNNDSSDDLEFSARNKGTTSKPKDQEDVQTN
jgi:hypothetical protein